MKADDEETVNHKNEVCLNTLLRLLPVGICFSSDASCQSITGNPAIFAQFEINSNANLSASSQIKNDPGRKIKYFKNGIQLTDKDLPLQRAVAEKKNIDALEIEILLPSGKRWFADVSGSPIFNKEGNVIGGLAVIADITRRKHAEDSLHQKQITLQNFYDSTPFMMGVSKIEGDETVIVSANRAMADFLAMEPQDLTDKTSSELGFPPDFNKLLVDSFECSKNQSASVHFEYEYPRAGRKRWLSATVAFIGNDTNGNPKFSFIIEDITNRKKSEAELQILTDELKRSNKELEDFAAISSRDMREPLRAIKGFTDLLIQRYGAKLDRKAREYIDYVYKGAMRMDVLLTGLLEYSRVHREGLNLEPVSAQRSLDDALANLQRNIAETKAVIVSDKMPIVKANGKQLTTLFQHLLHNAMKFQNEEKQDPPQIYVECRKYYNDWLFCVKDDGIGIDKQHHERIFNIFYHVNTLKKYSGTGVGLSICKKIAELNGGRIWVESDIGKGAAFYFTCKGDKIMQ